MSGLAVPTELSKLRGKQSVYCGHEARASCKGQARSQEVGAEILIFDELPVKQKLRSQLEAAH